MATTITGSAVSTASVTATTDVTTDIVNYDTAKDEAGTFTKQQVVQVVNTQDGEVASGTTTIPNDDTIPQITEGDQYMSLSITPKSTTNILVVETVIGMMGSSGAIVTSFALFVGGTSNALASSQSYFGAGGNVFPTTPLRHVMTAGSTSALTFSLRMGGTSGTTYFNSANATRRHGGASGSSITITEYTP